MTRPNKQDVSESYHKYMDLAEGDTIFEILEEDRSVVMNFYSGVPAEKHEYSYAEDKWPLKDVLCHLTSAEIYFCDLARRLTEGQNAEPLAPILDKYKMKDHVHKSMSALLQDFDKSRTTTIAFLKSFDADLLDKIQRINENHYTPHTIGYIIAGHGIHHSGIVEERYLNAGG